MSKAKEYYKKICYESNLWDEKNAKKLANKTLEDVKELIDKHIKENQRIKKASINEQTNATAQSRINQLSALKTELEELKL